MLLRQSYMWSSLRDGTCYALDTISDFVRQSSGWGCDQRANLHSACVLRFGARPHLITVVRYCVSLSGVRKCSGRGGGLKEFVPRILLFSRVPYLSPYFLLPSLLCFLISAFLLRSFVYLCTSVYLLSWLTSFMSSCLVSFIPSRTNSLSFSIIYPHIALFYCSFLNVPWLTATLVSLGLLKYKEIQYK